MYITGSIVHREHGNRRQQKLRRQSSSTKVNTAPSSTGFGGVKLDCREIHSQLYPSGPTPN